MISNIQTFSFIDVVWSRSIFQPQNIKLQFSHKFHLGTLRKLRDIQSLSFRLSECQSISIYLSNYFAYVLSFLFCVCCFVSVCLSACALISILFSHSFYLVLSLSLSFYHGHVGSKGSYASSKVFVTDKKNVQQTFT